jgi:hypothetical protein
MPAKRGTGIAMGALRPFLGLLTLLFGGKRIYFAKKDNMTRAIFALIFVLTKNRERLERLRKLVLGVT